MFQCQVYIVSELTALTINSNYDCFLNKLGTETIPAIGSVPFPSSSTRTREFSLTSFMTCLQDRTKAWTMNNYAWSHNFKDQIGTGAVSKVSQSHQPSTAYDVWEASSACSQKYFAATSAWVMLLYSMQGLPQSTGRRLPHLTHFYRKGGFPLHRRVSRECPQHESIDVRDCGCLTGGIQAA